jgi:hypothetical protein
MIGSVKSQYLRPQFMLMFDISAPQLEHFILAIIRAMFEVGPKPIQNASLAKPHRSSNAFVEEFTLY